MSNRIKKDRRITNTQELGPVSKDIGFLAAFRKGPLPPPAEMEKFEILYPGATKLLFDNFVNQTNHRMELEKTVISGDNERANKAQRNSFIIIMSILALSAVLFFMGKDGFAIASVFTAISQIIIAFISSTLSRKKERDNKRKELGT